MKRNGQKRMRKTRVVLTLMIGFSVVLAGCSGVGGLAGGDGDSGSADTAASGNGEDDASVGNADAGGSDADSGDDTSGGGAAAENGADDSDAGSSGSDGENSGASEASGSKSGNSDDVVVPLAEDPEDTEQWFNLSTPGRYEFEIETAEEGTGKMSFDTSPASDGQATIDTHYEMGDESSDSSVTAPVGEAQGQLATSPGFQYLILLSLSGIGPAAQLGGQDLEVGNELQRNQDGGTYSVKVTEKRNYGGVECYFIETRTNGTLSNEVCTQGSFRSAPYVATYNESGLERRIELVEYEKG